MRRIFIAVTVGLIALGGALAIAPRFVDWDRYRPEIAARFHAETGLALRIDGRAALTLLPFPRLRLGAVSVAAMPGMAGRDLVTIRSLDIRLSLGALLDGRIEALSVRLIDPVASLEFLAAGGANWAMAADDNGGGAWPLSIDQLSVVNGTVLYREGAAAERFEQVAATASLPGPGGPFRVDGSFTRRGRTLSVAASTGRAALGKLPLQLALEGAASGAALRFDGNVEHRAAGLVTTGKLRLDGPSLAAAAQDLGAADATAIPVGPFAIAARLAADAGGIRLDTVDASLDDLRGTGAASLTLAPAPHFAATLAVPQINLDRYPPGAGLSALARLALPPEWSGSLDATIDAATWRGDAIRQIQAKATHAAGIASVQELSALLPGGGQAKISFSLAPGPAAHAAGTIVASSDNLRALLAWAGLPAAGVPRDHLRRAVLSLGFKAGPGERIAVDPLDLELDNTRITGTASVAMAPRPTVDARLAIDALSLDGYLPADFGASSTGPAFAAARSIDARLDTTIGALTVAGRALQQLHFAATASNGVVTIADARLSGLGGASAQFSGKIADRDAHLPELSGHFNVAGPNLEPVLLQVFPGWTLAAATGPFTAAGDLDIADGAIAGKANLTLLGGTATFDGKIKLAPPQRVEGSIRLDHPSYAGLLQSLGAGAAGATGPLSIAAHLAGGPALTLDPLSIALGDQTLVGKGALTLGSQPHLAAELAGGALVLDGLIPTSRRAGDGSDPGALWGLDGDLALSAASISYGQWRFDRPRAKLSLHDERLSASDLSAGFLGGRLAGSLTLAKGDPSRLKLAFRLDDAALHTVLTDAAGDAVVDGRADAELALTGSGNSLAELVKSLAGNASIRARDGAVDGIDLGALTAAVAGSPAIVGRLRDALHGSTRFTTLTGDFSIAKGVAHSDDISLALAGGAARAGLTIDLPEWRLSGGAELRPSRPADAPAVTMLLAGPIDMPRRSFDLAPLESFVRARLPQLP